MKFGKYLWRHPACLLAVRSLLNVSFVFVKLLLLD